MRSLSAVRHRLAAAPGESPSPSARMCRSHPENKKKSVRNPQRVLSWTTDA